MSKQFKLIILANVMLALLYVVSSYIIYVDINQWSKWNIASIWTPILVTPYHIPNTPQVQMPVGSAWNLPFMLFWVILAVNLYFIIKLQKSKETQQVLS